MSWPHRIIMIVPAALRATANAIGRAIDPDNGGGKTFSIPLPTATEPTHYGAHTAAASSFVRIVQEVQSGQAALHDLVAADYAARWPDLTTPTAEQCQAFLTQTVIRIDEPWMVVLEELGLATSESDNDHDTAG